MDPKKNTEQPVVPEVMAQMTSVVCDEVLKFLSKSMSSGSGRKPKKRSEEHTSELQSQR